MTTGPEAVPGGPPPQAVILPMITGYWVTQAIYAAAKLDLADRVARGPRSAEDLAAEAGADSGALYRLLRALASLGIFAEDADGRFALTPLAECLRSDAPGSVRSMALMAGAEAFAAWGEFVSSVETGQPAWRGVFGKSIWEFFRDNAEAARVFNEAMTGLSRSTDEAVAGAYDFSRFKQVIDVAGGLGTQLAAILRANVHLRGILFDRPQVIQAGGPLADDPELVARTELIGGDFFEGLPRDLEVCLLKYVLHDWDDADAARILRSCHRSLVSGGRVLAVEELIPPGNAPAWSKLLDLHMLVIGGRERTEAQYRRIFASAGFRLERVYAVGMPPGLSLIEGVKQSA